MADARIRFEGDASQLIAETRRLRSEMGRVRDQVRETGREGQESNRTMIRGMEGLAAKAAAAVAAIRQIGVAVNVVANEINNADSSATAFERSLRSASASTQIPVARLRKIVEAASNLAPSQALDVVRAAREGGPTLSEDAIRGVMIGANKASVAGIDPVETARLAAGFQATGMGAAESANRAAFVVSRGGRQAARVLGGVSRTRALLGQGPISDMTIAQVAAQGEAGAEIPTVGSEYGILMPTATGNMASLSAARAANVKALRGFAVGRAAEDVLGDVRQSQVDRIERAEIRKQLAQRNAADLGKRAYVEEMEADYGEERDFWFWADKIGRSITGDAAADVMNRAMAETGRELPSLNRSGNDQLRALVDLQKESNALQKGSGVSVRGGP